MSGYEELRQMKTKAEMLPDETMEEMPKETVELDTSKIMIQILKRPTDPLTERLDTAIPQWLNAGFGVQQIRDQFMGWIDVLRNRQSRVFLEAKRFEYVMMIDADVGPTVDVPVLLARHQKPLVSACVPAYTAERGLFICIAVKGADGKAVFPSLNLTKKMPRTGLVPIHNCGTGCVMVRRDVMEKMWSLYDEFKHDREEARMAIIDVVAGVTPDDAGRASLHKWLRHINYEEDMTGGPFSIPQTVRDKGAETGALPRGEDICFTDRVRSAGIEMFADLEARCYHDKVMKLAWPVDAIEDDLDAEDWMLSAFGPGVVHSTIAR